jgi:hypothetical protein
MLGETEFANKLKRDIEAARSEVEEAKLGMEYARRTRDDEKYNLFYGVHESASATYKRLLEIQKKIKK